MNSEQKSWSDVVCDVDDLVTFEQFLDFFRRLTDEQQKQYRILRSAHEREVSNLLTRHDRLKFLRLVLEIPEAEAEVETVSPAPVAMPAAGTTVPASGAAFQLRSRDPRINPFAMSSMPLLPLPACNNPTSRLPLPPPPKRNPFFVDVSLNFQPMINPFGSSFNRNS
jgi:hypothetical protein